ncbi:MAG: DNA methyltransferase [Acidobacteriota bacterium]
MIRRVIYGCDGRGDGDSPYLTRYTLFSTPWIHLCIHVFHRSDADELHDHPWPFASLILWGGYIEESASKHAADMDRVVPMGLSGMGFRTVYPFSDDCIRAFTRHGFGLLSRKTIVTDVVRENNQTYRLGWTEQCKDGTTMGNGLPEYLLVFRKPPSDTSNGYADEPVVKSKADYTRSRWQIDAHGFERSSGNRLLSADDLAGVKHDAMFKMFRRFSLGQVYDYEHHVALSESLETCQHCGHIHVGERRCATGECECTIDGSRLPKNFMLLQPQSWHPDVWSDIARMRTQNGALKADGHEMHLCPMQFDICDRVIRQHSMPGETVYDPFAGVFTVPLRAMQLGRKGYGSELAPGYFATGCLYIEDAERSIATPSLFDLIAAEEGTVA